MRRAGALLVLLACVTAGLAACRDDAGSTDGLADGADGGWHRVADAPLSPRWGALSGWTGTEALFVGGLTSTPYPPGAGGAVDEEYSAEGAAYDPGSGSWREIQDAPMPLGYWFRTTMAADTMVVFASGQRSSGLHGPPWMAYDASGDAWRVLPRPPRPVGGLGMLSSLGKTVYVLDQEGVVMTLDVETDEWSSLPRSAQEPRTRLLTVVPTDLGVVVTGEVNPGLGEQPRFAEIWNGSSWRRFPDPVTAGAYWTGHHLVAFDLQVGGEGEPAGGRFDPATGESSSLPDAPGVGGAGAPGWGAEGSKLAGWGYVYDDADESWVRQPQLDDAAASYQSASVMGGGRIYVFGGFDESQGYDDDSGLSNRLWVLDVEGLT